MAIRERQLGSLTYTPGVTQLLDIPRDACFHLLQLACYGGTLTSAYPTSANTGATLYEGFPFSMMRSMRLIRNGSDVVWQGSGKQLAKESYYLNSRHPHARIMTIAANVETLLLVTSRGVSIPANDDGIGSNLVAFIGNSTNTAGTVTTYFEGQVEMWLQMGLTQNPSGSLVDARKLATFQLEVTWANDTDIKLAGTNVTSEVFAANWQLLSVDQDNVPVDVDFGTFKRSSQVYSSLQYGSNNNQILLPRGNFFHGIIMGTTAYKAGSTTVTRPENNVLSTIDNRINSNFSLRRFDFRQLQAKNVSNNSGRATAYAIAEGQPQGYAMIEYTSCTETAGEMVNTYSFDQFDIQVSLQALGSSTNGATTASTLPTIELLLQEVIPGVSAMKNAPQGSFAGSMAKTSAKIGAR